jgi:hypothetical protein
MGRDMLTVNIEPHLEEEKDDIIYTTKYSRYGDMFETRRYV